MEEEIGAGLGRVVFADTKHFLDYSRATKKVSLRDLQIIPGVETYHMVVLPQPATPLHQKRH